MPKYTKIPSSTIYVPAPSPAPPPPPPLHPQNPSVITLPTSALPTSDPLAALQPILYPTLPPPSSPNTQPTHSTDPVRITTWGPCKYKRRFSLRPNSVSKTKYMLVKPGLKQKNKNKRMMEEEEEVVWRSEASEEKGWREITLEGREEKHTTDMVEMVEGGGVRTTWVTCIRIVTVGVERRVGMGEEEGGEGREEEDGEAWDEAGGDGAMGIPLRRLEEGGEVS